MTLNVFNQHTPLVTVSRKAQPWWEHALVLAGEPRQERVKAGPCQFYLATSMAVLPSVFFETQWAGVLGHTNNMNMNNINGSKQHEAF